MTEFALVLPVLALLLFGIIQFGIAFNNYLTLTDAVRASARKAAVSRLSQNRIGDTVAEFDAAATNLDPVPAPDVTSTWEPGSEVTVSASFPYQIQLLGMVVLNGNLKSQTTERVE
jgi:Flp pilus assembly protein TadG